MYLNSEQQGLNQVLCCSYTGNSTHHGRYPAKIDCPVQVRLLWYKRFSLFLHLQGRWSQSIKLIRKLTMKSIVYYFLAAVAEISGCFSFWIWQRMGKSVLWLLPGTLSLLLFAWLLTLVESNIAGRAYAVYGGIYICCSLLWSWLVEGSVPDKWDISGALVCLLGAAIILLAPRG